MIPRVFLVQLVIVVLAMVGLATVIVVGNPLSLRARIQPWKRARAVAPSFAILLVVLAVNSVARRAGPDFSWLIGLNVTSTIYGIEGALVAEFQTFATPSLTAYLSFMYVYGYVFLLVFPFVVYAVLDDAEPLRVTATAYTLNYAIGLACYLLFVAYGPRNDMIGVDPLLYEYWPVSQLLTTEVNANTNVFPSLHTSLSITVALLAYRTRRIYPRWLYLSVPTAASISISTMYLGIHWATDVVAGVLLAFVCVYAAVRIVEGDDGGLRERIRRSGREDDPSGHRPRRGER